MRNTVGLSFCGSAVEKPPPIIIVIIIALPNDVIKMNKHLEDYEFKIDFSHEAVNKMLINILSEKDLNDPLIKNINRC